MGAESDISRGGHGGGGMPDRSGKDADTDSVEIAVARRLRGGSAGDERLGELGGLLLLRSRTRATFDEPLESDPAWVRRFPGPEQTAGMGIEFVRLGKDERAALDAWVRGED